MAHLTTAEALERDQNVLGKTYGAAYHHTSQALWTLTSYWDRYESLFGTAERVDLVNASNGEFWHAMQNALFEYVLLGICRLTDPASTGRRQNLTVAQLLQLDPALHKAELRKLVVRAEARAVFARSWRNLRIAHNDLDQILGSASHLEPATRNRVRKAIIGIHDVLRWIHLMHFDGEMYLRPLGDSDTNQMLLVLADGVAAKQRRRDAFERGDYVAAQPPSHPSVQSRPNKGERYSERIKLRIPKT